MIISSAPGRCGIVGNPTDMYGGSVISCSTTERAHCTLMESRRLTLCMDRHCEEILTADDLRLNGTHLDIPKAILLYFGLTPDNFSFRLQAGTDVPELAGLAGSTAMIVAILGAVLAQLGMDADRYYIAETARKIEYGIMGIMCGHQDQHMAAFGGLNYMDFRGKEALRQDEAEPLATIEPLHELVGDPPIVIAHTVITSNSGAIHENIRQRWLEGETQVVEGYLRMAELARLGKKAMLAGDWETLGGLMNENHVITRGLGGSGPPNDLLIEAALESGALGAKLAGAGKGGTIVALTLEPDRTVRALREAGADRILWPRPVDGLVVEATWQHQLLPEAAGSA